MSSRQAYITFNTTYTQCQFKTDVPQGIDLSLTLFYIYTPPKHTQLINNYKYTTHIKFKTHKNITLAHIKQEMYTHTVTTYPSTRKITTSNTTFKHSTHQKHHFMLT